MLDHRIRILIVDDHQMIIRGLTATLIPEPDLELVGTASNGADAVRRFRETKPDVTIMDIRLGREMSGIEAVKEIRREFPQARIIMLTVHTEEEKIYRALEAGAATYLLKETLGDCLVETIRQVHAGGGPIPPEIGRRFADRVVRPPLSARELDVLRLVAEGLRNKEIGERLNISEQTTLTHVKSIFTKLAVHDRTKAVTVAIKRGMIELGG
jgi:two-component system NarL family response regulator